MEYRLKPGLLLQAVGDETVILDPESGNYFTLDEVGSRMIALYRECAQMETTVSRLLREYETDAATLRHDLEALLEEMERQGLAQRAITEP